MDYLFFYVNCHYEKLRRPKNVQTFVFLLGIWRGGGDGGVGKRNKKLVFYDSGKFAGDWHFLLAVTCNRRASIFGRYYCLGVMLFKGNSAVF